MIEIRKVRNGDERSLAFVQATMIVLPMCRRKAGRQHSKIYCHRKRLISVPILTGL